MKKFEIDMSAGVKIPIVTAIGFIVFLLFQFLAAFLISKELMPMEWSCFISYVSSALGCMISGFIVSDSSKAALKGAAVGLLMSFLCFISGMILFKNEAISGIIWVVLPNVVFAILGACLKTVAVGRKQWKKR